MKKVNYTSDADNEEVNQKHKERRFVSWSQEEDDILREQIRLYGTDNWAIIASKFKDKTTRQCRRRWFTYLNSDFKKGGWSPEEDMLLCEAQKMFGNRWTEIAKVVSGRTDNAVKNRFTTLCKRRAKHQAFVKEEHNIASYINLNNKRIIFPNEFDAEAGPESGAPLKMARKCTSNTAENQEENLAVQCENANCLLEHPFTSVGAANDAQSCTVELPIEVHDEQIKKELINGSENKETKERFLNNDDPKVLPLMQQAELLNLLAMKVHLEKTEQSLESAWMMALQDFLKENKESDFLAFDHFDTDFPLENFKELVEHLKSSNEGNTPSWRDPDAYESSHNSSDYSAESILLSSVPGDKTEEDQAVDHVLHPDTGRESKSDPLDDQHSLPKERGICHTASTKEEFGTPHMTPIFGALAAAIPSPKFSESEKRFLMKMLGMESTSPSRVTNPPQPPSCKRSLLRCL